MVTCSAERALRRWLLAHVNERRGVRQCLSYEQPGLQMKWAAVGYLVTQSLIQNVRVPTSRVSLLDLNWIVSLAIDKDCRLEEAVWGCLAYSDAHVMVHNSSLQEEQYLAVAAEADAATAGLPSEVGHCSQKKLAAPTCVRLCSTKNMRHACTSTVAADVQGHGWC